MKIPRPTARFLEQAKVYEHFAESFHVPKKDGDLEKAFVLESLDHKRGTMTTKIPTYSGTDWSHKIDLDKVTITHPNGTKEYGSHPRLFFNTVAEALLWFEHGRDRSIHFFYSCPECLAMPGASPDSGPLCDECSAEVTARQAVKALTTEPAQD